MVPLNESALEDEILDRLYLFGLDDGDALVPAGTSGRATNSTPSFSASLETRRHLSKTTFASHWRSICRSSAERLMGPGPRSALSPDVEMMGSVDLNYVGGLVRDAPRARPLDVPSEGDGIGRRESEETCRFDGEARRLLAKSLAWCLPLRFATYCLNARTLGSPSATDCGFATGCEKD